MEDRGSWNVDRGEKQEERTETPASLRRLEIWTASIALAGTVYRLSSKWPREEVYGLTSQARRSAVSIPANIAEGVGRASPKEIIRFCRIALGSAYELHTLLHLAVNLGLSLQNEVEIVLKEIDSLLKRLSRFIQYQEKKI